MQTIIICDDAATVALLRMLKTGKIFPFSVGLQRERVVRCVCMKKWQIFPLFRAGHSNTHCKRFRFW